ncbi:MAG TPA: hypothetical protein VGR35_05760 [Tepidisphaeraceae bacterium]|nr:hypothetical protein [Tepidisphaeraceae bacterium]
MSRSIMPVVLRSARSTAAAAAMALACAGIAGCASYAAPGGPADLGVMGVQPQLAADREAQTGATMQEKFDRKPLARFPAAIAVARVQAPGYRSRTARSYGGHGGAYSVVTTRDVEKPEHFEKLSKLELIDGIGPINRLLLPTTGLRSDQELREAAASMQADMLLIYTLDTSVYVRDMAKPLSIVSLGLSPNQQARVTTTASAVLMDTRNGYVYGLAEATDSYNRLASAWTNEDAIDAARIRTESAAFDKLVDELEKTWAGVVARYARPAAARINGG